MTISYRQEGLYVVSPNDVLVLSIDTAISPTALIYGVRTSFTGEGGKSRNFEFYPTHYGVGCLWGLFDGYVTHKSYIEYPNQYHYTGISTDSTAEPSFIYPDTIINEGSTEVEVSKVQLENGNPSFEYSFTGGIGLPSIYIDSAVDGAPVSDFQLKPINRMVLKSKNRLYSNSKFADTVVLEVFRTAKQPVTLDLIHIR